MATTAIIIAAAVTAVAAGAGAYMQSESAAAQVKAAERRSDWQQQVELQQTEVARRQVQAKTHRMLNAQASKAGNAGVVAGEGSLLTDQLESASLAQYDEDLAAGAPWAAGPYDGLRQQLRSVGRDWEAGLR